MTTAADAIAVFSAMMGWRVHQMTRQARFLQLAKDDDGTRLDLWPLGRQSRPEHVIPRHLTSLAISLAAADPITRGPFVVQAFRMLQPKPPANGSAFGPTFDALVDHFSRPEGMKLRPRLFHSNSAIALYPVMNARAVIHLAGVRQDFVAGNEDVARVAVLVRQSSAGIIRIGQIDFGVIAKMSDMWAATRASVPSLAEAPPMLGQASSSLLASLLETHTP
jgi:hypothetical protein